jgi:hypothetical protein
VPDAPETWSRYGYALGDPVGGWDPDGRCAVDFSWEYFVRVECAHVRDFLFKDLPAIDRAAGRGVVAAFDAAFDVVLTVGGALAYGVGIENDATAARAERFANGIVALAHAARNYDATFAALVHGTASGFRRYVDDLANGREERAAEAAARFAAEVELALVPTGAAARHLRNVAKARAGGVLTSVRRAAAHVSPPPPVVPRPTVARGSPWTLDDRFSVDLSGFERASAAARGGVAEPIVVLNRVDGWGRGGYAPKGLEPYLVLNRTHAGSMPSPKGLGPGGGRLQSHHALQDEWARQNLPGYRSGLAPTVTLETGKGMPHTTISNLQRARRDARLTSGNGKWSSSLQDELGHTVSDLRTAGFGNETIGAVMEQTYRMLDKLGVSYTRVGF